MKTLNPTQPAAKIPREVAAACAAAEKDPRELLAWALRDDEVVLILTSGAKLRVSRRDQTQSRREAQQRRAEAARERDIDQSRGGKIGRDA